jgi:diacylglycerol kinase (ATP)
MAEPVQLRRDSPDGPPAPAPRAPEPHPSQLPPPEWGGFLSSFRHAWNGLLIAATRDTNMKVHIVSALLVGLVGSGIPLGLAEKVTLIFCVILVFFAEILNTALEALVDLHTEDFRELAKITKDTAAAGVLVLALGTVVIFAALLVYNWDTVVAHQERVWRQTAAGVPLAASAALLLWSRARPRWVDHLLFLFGALLLGLTATWTTSIVFTTMTTGIFVLARAAAARRGTI